MQFGIFSVGDIAPDPTTGTTQSEAERISNLVRVAQRADEVGLDVFARANTIIPPSYRRRRPRCSRTSRRSRSASS